MRTITYSVPRPPMECWDGTTISIQIVPIGMNGGGPYTAVEVGFVTRADGTRCVMPECWLDYAVDRTLTSDVFTYVPVRLVDNFIQAHGGPRTWS